MERLGNDTPATPDTPPESTEEILEAVDPKLRDKVEGQLDDDLKEALANAAALGYSLSRVAGISPALAKKVTEQGLDARAKRFAYQLEQETLQRERAARLEGPPWGLELPHQATLREIYSRLQQRRAEEAQKDRTAAQRNEDIRNAAADARKQILKAAADVAGALRQNGIAPTTEVYTRSNETTVKRKLFAEKKKPRNVLFPKIPKVWGKVELRGKTEYSTRGWLLKVESLAANAKLLLTEDGRLLSCYATVDEGNSAKKGSLIVTEGNGSYLDEDYASDITAPMVSETDELNRAENVFRREAIVQEAVLNLLAERDLNYPPEEDAPASTHPDTGTPPRRITPTRRSPGARYR